MDRYAEVDFQWRSLRSLRIAIVPPQSLNKATTLPNKRRPTASYTYDERPWVLP